MDSQEAEVIKLQTRIREYMKRALDPFIGTKLDARAIENIRQVSQTVLRELGAVPDKFKFEVRALENDTVTIEPRNLYTAVAFILHRVVPEIVEEEGIYLDVDTGMEVSYYHKTGALVKPAGPCDFVQLDATIGVPKEAQSEAAEDQEHWDDADYVDGSP